MQGRLTRSFQFQRAISYLNLRIMLSTQLGSISAVPPAGHVALRVRVVLRDHPDPRPLTYSICLPVSCVTSKQESRSERSHHTLPYLSYSTLSFANFKSKSTSTARQLDRLSLGLSSGLATKARERAPRTSFTVAGTPATRHGAPTHPLCEFK